MARESDAPVDAAVVGIVDGQEIDETEEKDVSGTSEPYYRFQRIYGQHKRMGNSLIHKLRHHIYHDDLYDCGGGRQNPRQ